MFPSLRVGKAHRAWRLIMWISTLRGMLPVLEERLDIVTQYQATMALGNQCLYSVSSNGSHIHTADLI